MSCEWLPRLRQAAASPLPASAGLADWWRDFRVGPDALDTAREAGLAGGRLAFCFAGGYQAALRRLQPSLPEHAFAALLLTEGKRQRPEELQTQLVPAGDGRFLLHGEKSFVTGGALADTWLVVARMPDPSATAVPKTVVVRMSPGCEGASLLDRPPVGLLDALPHARARFDGVPVNEAQFLPGDGWRDHARPFRTIEDIHVSLAIAAHLAAQGLREGWPDALLATLIAAMARLEDAGRRDPSDAGTHLLLAGAEQELQGVAAAVTQRVADRDDAFARDWRADGMVMALAVPARLKRLEKALATLRPTRV